MTLPDGRVFQIGVYALEGVFLTPFAYLGLIGCGWVLKKLSPVTFDPAPE